ncbi:MAG TPA: DUF4097 family beta strand repeat protein [Firmicutes bacterium]|nr:DUF4097 family beta strand repeat protein [Bacillota bacterium]
MSIFKRIVLILGIVAGVSFLGIAISIPFAIHDVTSIYNTALQESEENKQNQAVVSGAKRIDLESSGYWFHVEVRQSEDDRAHIEYYHNQLYQTIVTVTEQTDRTTVMLGIKQDLPMFNFSIKTMIESVVSDSKSNNVILYLPKDYSLYSDRFDGNLYYADSVEFANQKELAQQQEAEEHQEKYEDYVERAMELDDDIKEYYQEIEQYKAQYMEAGAQSEEGYSGYDYSQFLSDITSAYNSIARFEKSRIEIAYNVSSSFDSVAAWEKANALLEQKKQFDLKDGDLQRVEQEFRAGTISQSVYEAQRASLQSELDGIAAERDTLQAEYDQLFANLG